jgi:ribonucleoside-diphosphate reductase alpha chain
MKTLEGLSRIIHKERYSQEHEQEWIDTTSRVVNYLAQAETSPETRADFISKGIDFIGNLDILPGGRILANAGKPEAQLLNCFVIPIDDSRESIGEAVKNYLIISGTGGGVGLSFKNIRYKGAPIQKAGGVSSGSVSFMDVLNSVADTIKIGGGRRAATMLSLPASHPDVEDFCHHKLDKGKLNNANVSVEINSKFIEAVKENKTWDLTWAGKTVRPIKARKLWDYMVKNALNSGEPGFMNLELANKMSNSYYYNTLQTSNPCLTKDFTFVTNNGLRKLGDIKVGDIVWTGKSWSPITALWSTGVKEVIRYSLSNGSTIDMTSNHRVVSNGTKSEIAVVEATNAKIDKQSYGSFDLASVADCGDNSRKDVALLAGYLFGDGSMQKNGGVAAYINIGKKDADAETVFADFTERIVTGSGKRLLKLKDQYTFDSLELDYAPMTSRNIPDFWKFAGYESVALFLKGLYSANGSVITTGGKAVRIALKTSNRQVAETIHEMLEALRIHSYITVNKAKNVKFNNGEYLCKESYDVNTTDIENFMSLIGFIHEYKTKTALNYGSCKKQVTRRPSIVSSTSMGEQEVFEFTVEADEHMAAHKGLLISNCGEIFLPAFGVCCLASINVSNFLSGSGLDLERFREAVTFGVRFLDNVLTVNHYPLPEIKEVASGERRIGLGLTGVHSAMLNLGIKYSSRAGIAFIEHCYEELRNASYLASTELAAEKGSFPKFDAEKYLESGFTKTLPASIRRKIAKNGMRNVTCNTQAPTGTISLLAGVSSGIEPIFAPVFKRTFFSDDSSTGRKSTYVIDDTVRQALESGKKFEDLQHFEGAYDVPVKKHFQAQEAAQRFIDQAVSKTINLPQDFSEEDLSEFMLQYAPFLKGSTIYRQGSREFEPLTPVELNAENFKLALEGGESEVVDNSCPSGKCDL